VLLCLHRYAKELREGWARQKEWLETVRPEWSSSDEEEEEEEEDEKGGMLPRSRDAVEAQMERELEVRTQTMIT
jgi:hypothetical protein